MVKDYLFCMTYLWKSSQTSLSPNVGVSYICSCFQNGITVLGIFHCSILLLLLLFFSFGKFYTECSTFLVCCRFLFHQFSHVSRHSPSPYITIVPCTQLKHCQVFFPYVIGINGCTKILFMWCFTDVMCTIWKQSWYSHKDCFFFSFTCVHMDTNNMGGGKC